MFPPYPSLILENQFGEQTNNFVKGGSSLLWCNFIVDHSNGNGLGIRSLKGQGVANVFMHTSATAAANNPNPAVGGIVVELAAAYLGYVNGSYGFGSPISGTPINVTSGLTQFQLYVIISVGTTTPAQWLALGLAANVVPAVGACFVAATASAGSGTGVVEALASTGSNVSGLELAGDPNQTCNVSSGALIYCQTFGATSSGSTVKIPVAPVDNTVIGLTFNMIPVAAPVI